MATFTVEDAVRGTRGALVGGDRHVTVDAGLLESHGATTFEDTVALLLKRLAPGDALLVQGSRGMRMERVVDALGARFGGWDG